MKKYLVLCAIMALFSSCDTFWQGMTQGKGGYSGYGMGMGQSSNFSTKKEN